jgi:hypothetical protein
LVEPDFAGRLSGFTLLFEAFILILAAQMQELQIACRQHVRYRLPARACSCPRALAKLDR